MSNKVITRFAPSPTGYFHAGSYRTALFAWIYAKQNDGKFILRIEDTDKERSKKEYEENIIESLKWLGLEYDEFYKQSERIEIYKKYIKKLIDSGNAYISDETGKQESSNTKVIRFKNPNKKVGFNDLIRGHVEFDTTELGDFIIAKNENEPIFHLANVIDDFESGITHIIRGEDHISNTPRQILIFEAIGAKPPLYAHIPLLLSKDRSKLSKRHGAISIGEYKERGYIGEAIINYLALLGWHPADDREILSIEEIQKEFSLERVQRGGAIFDEDKLLWFNRQYLLKLSDADFTKKTLSFLPEWLSSKSDIFKRLLPMLRDKTHKLSDLSQMLNKDGELSFIKDLAEYDPKLLLWKKNPEQKNTLENLGKVKEIIKEINLNDFTADTIKNSIWKYAEEKGRGDVLWPFRVALTGQEKSPDPFMSAYILGKDESVARLEKAYKLLGTK
jgi:glutamyl-tRNA synthetase